MKRVLTIPCIALLLLAGFSLSLRAQDSPPDPAQDGGEQVNKQDAKKSIGQESDENIQSNQAVNFDPQVAALYYLMRAYDPNQAESQQKQAVKNLLDGYYNLYQGDTAQSAQGDAAKNVYLNLLQQQGNRPALLWQDYYQNNSEALQQFHLHSQGNPRQNLYYQDPATAYQFLLNTQGNVSKYWLGLQTGPLAEDVRPFLNLPEDQGVVVLSVVDDSPAQDAGLETNDIVLSLGDQPISKVEDLYAIVGKIKDKPASMKIVRRGEEMTLEITAVERPKPAQPSDHQAAQEFWRANQSPYTAGLEYQWFRNGNEAARVAELEKQVKELTERLEKLEKQAGK